MLPDLYVNLPLALITPSVEPALSLAAHYRVIACAIKNKELLTLWVKAKEHGKPVFRAVSLRGKTR